MACEAVITEEVKSISAINQGRLVKRGVDGLLILLATIPGVLTVQRYYRETHILIDDGSYVDFSEEVGYITIDATISPSILMSLNLMSDNCSKRLIKNQSVSFQASNVPSLLEHIFMETSISKSLWRGAALS